MEPVPIKKIQHFEEKQIQISNDKYLTIGERIAAGGYGVVCRGIMRYIENHQRTVEEVNRFVFNF
jgi:hypothetical protein